MHDDYHINPDQLFKKPDEHPIKLKGYEQEKEEQNPKQQNENRLSFDFCELDADLMLESTPHSYRNEYRCSSKVPNQYVFN